MGDTGEISMKRLSWVSLFIPAFLIYTIGLLMVYDASSGEIVDLAVAKNEFGPFFKQLLWGMASSCTALILYSIGWKSVKSQSPLIYLLLTLSLVLVFIPGVGIEANGSKRWISLLGIRFQPSEFIKIFLPMFFLDYVSKRGSTLYVSFSSFCALMALTFIPIALIVIEPNNGTAGVISLTIGLLLVITKIPYRYWLLPTALIVVSLISFAMSSSYVQSRLQSYKNPELDIKGRGHQPYQAKIAAGSGGLFGRGPAKSLQKLSYLPEAQNDYIAAIYAEEYGFIGMCVLIALYLWLIFAMAYHISYLYEMSSFSWGLVMLFLVSLQMFMNLGVVSGLLPSTGLNLPFFSQGGSSLIANGSALGILASMSKEDLLRSKKL
ncbi:MAG: putative peptidoglycan glycosyltransferase FtsW [Chlamydia sp.]